MPIFLCEISHVCIHFSFLWCCKSLFRCLLVRHILRRKRFLEVAIFRYLVLCWRSSKHGRILKKLSTVLSDLVCSQIWLFSSCGLLSLWLHHKIEKKVRESPAPASLTSSMHICVGRSSQWTVAYALLTSLLVRAGSLNRNRLRHMAKSWWNGCKRTPETSGGATEAAIISWFSEEHRGILM